MKKKGRAPVFQQAEMYTKHTKCDTKKEKGTEAHTQLIKKTSNQKPWSGEMIEDHGV